MILKPGKWSPSWEDESYYGDWRKRKLKEWAEALGAGLGSWHFPLTVTKSPGRVRGRGVMCTHLYFEMIAARGMENGLGKSQGQRQRVQLEANASIIRETMEAGDRGSKDGAMYPDMRDT